MPPTTDNKPPFSEKHHVHVGPILGILVVILVLILGGLYLWGGALNNQNATVMEGRTIPNNEPETPRAVADQEILNTVSSSDELDAISADLESTRLESIDGDFDQVEAEMTTALE